MQSFWNAVVGVTAALAIVLAYISIRAQRKADDNQAFLRLHEVLMGDEMRVGRALLIESGKIGSLPDLNTRQNRQMTHALGGLETAGIYIDQGLMSLDRFIIVWHHNLRAMQRAAEMMTKQRVEEHEGWWPWPHLWPLFDAAAVFHDPRMICCQHEGRWPHSTVQTPS